MLVNFRNPLQSNPATIQGKDAQGLPFFVIRPHVLTPLRAKAADGCANVLAFALLLGCAWWYIVHSSRDASEAIWLVALVGAAYAGLPWVVRLTFCRRAEIRMTTDTIAVRDLWSWRHYSRLLEHQFVLLPHDRAAQERLDDDFALREASSRGVVIQRFPYYGSSAHVVLVYAGHREDVLTVFGQRDAVAVLQRLQYCDRCLDKALAMGRGVPHRAEDEWDQTPGGISS